jgi:uncharacterized protein (DUF1800 family)
MRIDDEATRTAVAAHRFGLGEASLAGLRRDALGWLAGQIGPAEPARGSGLLTTAQALDLIAAEREKRIAARNPPPGMTAAEVLAGHYRETIVADARSRLVSAALAERPFAERLHLFWANHFTVSLAKGSVRGLVGPFEREAIRPHIAGRFEDLLVASTTHPAMLRYLDNHLSAGPGSRIVGRAARRAQRAGEAPRITGLNENLAREVLELHTLGVDGGYTQADVTSFARVLTGWRAPVRPLREPRSQDRATPGATARPGNDFRSDEDSDRFDANWHEPGRKTVLGKSYPEGPEALHQVLRDLARHPSTARFLATKLAHHFVADEPPAALIERMAGAYLRGDGQLPAMYRALLESPEAWEPSPSKLKTPEEFVISAVRVLGLPQSVFDRRDAAGINALGQRVHFAPSPAGWGDSADDWLGPEALWKRVEWSTRVGERLGASIDARALAAASLGPRLSEASRTQIDRAADGAQALALLLMAPEFQRR